MSDTKQNSDDKDYKMKPETKIPNLLKIGDIIRDRYKVDELLACGSYSQVYRAHDKTKSQFVAVKIATADLDPRRMTVEQMVLISLRGKKHFPVLFSMGQINGLPFLIMELVGRSILELKIRQPEKKLLPETVYRVSMQVISALYSMHSAGFLHRDIKPSNIFIGRGMQLRTIYLLNYGLARIFTQIDGTARKPRDHVNFRGTAHYASLNVHSNRESGPCDDLIAWFYSMVELINGKLPWCDLTVVKDIEQLKKQTTLESLCNDEKNALLEYATYVTSLQYSDKPNYTRMYTIFRSAAKCKEDSPFEWEKNTSFVFIRLYKIRKLRTGIES